MENRMNKLTENTINEWVAEYPCEKGHWVKGLILNREGIRIVTALYKEEDGVVGEDADGNAVPIALSLKILVNSKLVALFPFAYINDRYVCDNFDAEFANSWETLINYSPKIKNALIGEYGVGAI